MTQDWTRDVAHVVRCGELAATQCRKRFGAEQECDGSARACAVENRRMRARASDYLNNIALYSRLDARVADFKTAARDGVRINERANVNSVEITRVEASIPVGDDLLLRVLRRIVEQDFEQEAIKLRFGQRVRAFVFNRILGGEHGEERRERVGFAVNRRLSLFHRFEERGLGL